MSGVIEDNFIGKLLVEMKSNFNKSTANCTEDVSGKIVKDKIVKVVPKPQKVDEKEEKGDTVKKISDLNVQDKMKVQKRTKSCEVESVKRLKVTSQIVQSFKMQDVQAADNDINSTTTSAIDCESESSNILSKELKNKEDKDKFCDTNAGLVEKTNKMEDTRDVKESVSPGRRSLRLKTSAPEVIKDVDASNIKRSPRRRSKEYSDSVLANAIARKEKSYESSNPQPRLSRRIKPTAKILANKELRLGIEMQNDARSLNNDICKLKFKENERISKAKSDSGIESVISSGSEDNEILNNKNNLKQMQEKHLSILGLRAVDKSEDDFAKYENTQILMDTGNSSISPTDRNLRRSQRDRTKKSDNKLDDNSVLMKESNYKKYFRKSIIPHSSSFAEGDCVNDTDSNLFTSSNLEVESTNEMLDNKKIETDLNKFDKNEPMDLDCTINISNKSYKESRNDTHDGTDMLCLCQKRNNIFINLENRLGNIYCGAVDSIDNRFIGCSNSLLDNGVPVESNSDVMLLRANKHLPYIIMCSNHVSRFTRHLSCSGCGAFCTQGSFVICNNKHLYHRQCSIMKNNNSICPHCGILSPNFNIQLQIKKGHNMVFTPNQDDSTISARMSFSSECNMSNSAKFSNDFKSRPRTPPILSPDVVSMLANMKYLENNHDIGNADELSKAIKRNNCEKVIQILAGNLDINSIMNESTQSTALHQACELGHIGIIHILVVLGAEINVFDKFQKTPLICAILSDQLEAVQYLIKAGCDLSLKGPDGMTALHLAAKDGNLEACRLLVTSPRMSLKQIDLLDEGGWTPLVWAAEHGHALVIRYLLECNADPFICDSQQNIVLHWAALNGNHKITEMLLDRGCDIDSTNVNGETPLHIAARYNNYQCALILITRGANVMSRNCAGETPLESCEIIDGECYNLIKINAQLQKYVPNNKRNMVIANDISRGKELNPIQCINTVDSECEPRDYTYTTNLYITSNEIRTTIHHDKVIGCECSDRCSGSSENNSCCCLSLNTRCLYDEDGRLLPDFDFEDPPMIFECNDKCSCNKITCVNRVVQRGVSQRLELFRTESCGWGVRTLKDIPKGAFVAEYTGEILTDFDAKRREDDSYLFHLYHSESESYCLDGRHYGNVSRFLNHSCEPNVCPIRVFTDHQDIRFPRIAFFVNRDVNAGEEIRFDYGDKFWEVKHNDFMCMCGSERCRYSDNMVLAKDSNKLNS